MKIKKIVKNGRYLDVYIKRPYFNSNKLYFKLFEKYSNNTDYNFDAMYDESGKYIICKFFLRSREDIAPYLRISDETEEWLKILKKREDKAIKYVKQLKKNLNSSFINNENLRDYIQDMLDEILKRLDGEE